MAMATAPCAQELAGGPMVDADARWSPRCSPRTRTGAPGGYGVPNAVVRRAVERGGAETGLAGLQAALEPPGPYRGAVARLGARAVATRAAPADRDARGDE